MNEPALEAAARALKELKFRRPTFKEQAQAAITAYLEALPSEHGELKAALRKKIEHGIVNHTGISANGIPDATCTEAADAIEALEADNKIIWAAKEKNEADGINGRAWRKRAEAAEAELDKWQKLVGQQHHSEHGLEREKLLLQARVKELEGALRGFYKAIHGVPFKLTHKPILDAQQIARAALEQTNETG